jgi:hypothetical protein
MKKFVIARKKKKIDWAAIDKMGTNEIIELYVKRFLLKKEPR